MGACASIMPKAMRSGVDGGAPEPPKEEAAAEVVEVQAKEKEVTVEGGENKAEGGADHSGAKPADDEKNKDGDHRRSLGSLLESEEVKETPKTEKINSETQTIAEEQIPEEALPVSDKPAGEPAEKEVVPYIAPVARATEEDKETEKK